MKVANASLLVLLATLAMVSAIFFQTGIVIGSVFIFIALRKHALIMPEER